jgi:hypothetical protein
MKKIVLGSLLAYHALFAEVIVPNILTNNDFETHEYQFFVTNTKEIAITKEMVAKVIFEGEIEDYYTFYNEMNSKSFKVSEQLVNNILLNQNKVLGNALFFKDVKALQNIGIASVGSLALNTLLGGILGDDTYVKVVDYYQGDVLQTRLIKYLVSDDDLDKAERELVYKTSSNQSYHFRSGGFQSMNYK